MHSEAMRAYVERSVTPRVRALVAGIEADADARSSRAAARSALGGWQEGRRGAAGARSVRESLRPTSAVGRLAGHVQGFERTASRCHTAR